MPNTRYSKPGSDPDGSNERFLASGKLRGINIGLNIITRVGRCRPPREHRAMIWLHNYAQIQNLTADALSTELDLSKADIRAALTDPDADLTRFLARVEAFRTEFERGIPVMVPTEVQRTISKGVRFAAQEFAPVEIIGKTRMGKTDCAWSEYLRLMDRAIWLDTPSDETERNFIFELARVLGIGTGGGKKTGQVRPQVKGCFGRGMIEMIFCDEGHYLWPADIKCKPKRIEFLREIHDGTGTAVIIFGTPQFSESMNKSLEVCTRWAPGQWEGRVVRYHLDDAMSEADLEAVARCHAPDMDADCIALLVTAAKATQGYCGHMVNVVRLARFEAGESRAAVSVDHVKAAIKQMARGTRLEALAKAHAEGGKITKLRRAA